MRAKVATILRRVVLAAIASAGLLACGDIVDWFAGSYQPEDRGGAQVPAYLIVQAAPDAVQPQRGDLGTIVYVQAAGGDRIGVRVMSGTFTDFESDAGLERGCYAVLPLTPFAVKPADGAEALFFVDLLDQDDAGPPPEAGVDAAPAETGASGPPSQATCGAGFHPILSAIAVVSDSRIVIIDGGFSEAAASDAPAADSSDAAAAATDGPDGQ